MDDGNILLVEDDLNDVDLTLRAFRKSTITNELTVIRDGVKALDFLFGTGDFPSRSMKSLPTIILLDLNLPKINGLEVLKKIRSDERTRLIPVIILTSSTEEKDLVNCYAQGANSYVRKPVKFEDFIQTAQQIGEYWLMLNESPPLRERRE